MTFAEPISAEFRKSAGGLKTTFVAHRDYLLANTQVDRLMQDEQVRSRVFRLSRIDNRLRPFNATIVPQKPERVLLFNGSGGYGDQIMTWPLAKILAQRFEVHVLADPGNEICWWNMPFVRTVQTIPIQWDIVKMFDYFVCFEHLVNLDEHPDQQHPVDIMLHRVGIDPAIIPDEAKTVQPVFTHGEMASTQQWTSKGPVGIYQLASANQVRALPPSDSAYVLTTLAERFPHIHWIVTYDEFVSKEYAELADKMASDRQLQNVSLVAFGSALRELWALISQAAITVGPDSMVMHIAGNLGVPCVGLWGPIAPDRRAKYYKNHFPIYHQKFCPHSPCFTYLGNFPRYCPPRPTPRNVCEVLAGISADEVADAVGKMVRMP